MKKIIGIILCLFLVCGCATSHLENGDESIVTFKDGGISAQELYEKIKKTYGSSAMIELIDTELLAKEYKKDNEENKYIKDVINSLKDEWGDDFLTNINNYYNVSTEKEFKEYIRLSYRRNKWIEDYSESIVNDTQINDYYETALIGDIEASHILIKSKATSTMTDDEKSKAETEALELAKTIIDKLNNGEKFEDLAKEYSDDAANSSKGGSLGTFNDRSNYDENFLEAAKTLEVGKYSSTPVKSQYGYHIIYKVKQNDKPELTDDLKKEIITEVAKDLKASDSNFNTKALLALREKYDVKITDSDLEKDYNKTYGLE